jgi:HAD superfamily hydrolase (TIGR01509 family)
VVIFDCNGVLVDGEAIAAAVAAEEFTRFGFPLSAQIVGHFFTGRRTSDMLAHVETAAGRKLPPNFSTILASAMLRRFQAELRATPHAAYALTWLRGPKCVASSAPLDRVRFCLETTGLIRYFGPHLFSANDIRRGKPAPDLFLHAAARMGIAPRDCVVVEDSPIGVQAALAAGMTAIGFAGGSHAGPQLPSLLAAAGARTIIADLRALKSTLVALRGW